jgi:hypothetical protein
MKRCAALLSAAVALTLATGVDARERNTDTPNLRPLDKASGALLADAQQKSATVRELVDKLDAGNVVVYLNVAPLNRYTPESGLRYVSTTKYQRFVLVTIAEDATAARRIELLGHELQHAIEVAGTPWVTSDSLLQSMMTMVGWRDSTRARGYETTAAEVTERQVRRDLRAAAGSQR